MLRSKEKNIPKLVIQQYSNIILPNQRQTSSKLLQSVALFECKDINQLVRQISQQCCILTSWKTFAQRIQESHGQIQNNFNTFNKDQFIMRTEQCYNQNSPHYVAFYCQKSGKQGYGINKLISIEQILHFLTTQQIQYFLKIKFPFRVPQSFIEFNKKQSVNYLNILYKQEQQTFIRWHPEAIIVDKLDQEQLKLFQTISRVIKNIKPSVLLLQQKQCLIINNGRFLHSKTQTTNIDQLFYRIRFNLDPKIKGQFKTEVICNNQNYNKQLKKYIQKFTLELNQESKFPFSQDLFSLQTFKFDSSFKKLQILKTKLNTFYKTIVRLYSQNDKIGLSLRKILNWPAQINKLIEQMNQKIPYEIGFYKPNFILQEIQKNIFKPRIFELNALQELKQFILSLQLQKLFFEKQTQNNTQIKIQQIILNKIKDEKLIHFITNRQQLMGPLLLNTILKNFGIQIKTLKICNIKTEIADNKIKKILDSDGNQIKCAILDLSHLQFIEWIKKEPQQLHFIIFNIITLNDLRSIFITHDQRVLTIFNEKTQFTKQLELNYLFHAEISTLKKYLIPTYIIEQTMIQDQLITQNKDKWVIKTTNKQNQISIIFGYQIDKATWLQLIKQKTGSILQQFVKPLTIPIIYNQNLKYSAQQRVKIYYSICTFSCYNDQFLGIGSTIVSQNININSSSKVFFLPTTIQSQKSQIQKFNYYEKINNIKIYSSTEIKKLCQQKYGRQILKISKFDILKNNQKNQLQQRWKNCYISPSGGSTNNSCYIVNQIHQNHYLRKSLGEEFEQNKILQNTDVCLVIQSSTNLYRARQIFTQYCELVGATAIPLDHEASNQILLSFANYFNPNVFISAPSRLVSFCKFMEQNQNSLINIKKILYGGQILYDNQRYLVKKVFPNAELCSVYGSAQSGVWAYTRKGFQQNHIFNYPNTVYQLQIQQPNQFGVGKLLVTSLIRTKTPIYKFQMGQYARIINSNTFQLIARPSVLKFRILFLDFQVQQWHQLLKDTQRWQIIIQNIPDPKMTFKIKLQKQNQTQFLQFKDKIIAYLLERYRGVNGVENQNDYNSLVKIVQNVKEDSQFVKCMPSNKFYNIVDRRLK